MDYFLRRERRRLLDDLVDLQREEDLQRQCQIILKGLQKSRYESDDEDEHKSSQRRRKEYCLIKLTYQNPNTRRRKHTDEIMISLQNQTVFKGCLRDGEQLTFKSKRYRNDSKLKLKFYINDLLEEEITACCEHGLIGRNRRHHPFQIENITGGKPCQNCESDDDDKTPRALSPVPRPIVRKDSPPIFKNPRSISQSSSVVSEEQPPEPKPKPKPRKKISKLLSPEPPDNKASSEGLLAGGKKSPDAQEAMFSRFDEVSQTDEDSVADSLPSVQQLPPKQKHGPPQLSSMLSATESVDVPTANIHESTSENLFNSSPNTQQKTTSLTNSNLAYNQTESNKHLSRQSSTVETTQSEPGTSMSLNTPSEMALAHDATQLLLARLGLVQQQQVEHPEIPSAGPPREKGNVEYFMIIYLNDSPPDESVKKHLRGLVNFLKIFDDDDDCIAFINTVINEKIILIIAKSFENFLVPRIRELQQIYSIYIIAEDKHRTDQGDQNNKGFQRYQVDRNDRFDRNDRDKQADSNDRDDKTDRNSQDDKTDQDTQNGQGTQNDQSTQDNQGNKIDQHTQDDQNDESTQDDQGDTTDQHTQDDQGDTTDQYTQDHQGDTTDQHTQDDQNDQSIQDDQNDQSTQDDQGNQDEQGDQADHDKQDDKSTQDDQNNQSTQGDQGNQDEQGDQADHDKQDDKSTQDDQNDQSVQDDQGNQDEQNDQADQDKQDDKSNRDDQDTRDDLSSINSKVQGFYTDINDIYERISQDINKIARDLVIYLNASSSAVTLEPVVEYFLLLHEILLDKIETKNDMKDLITFARQEYEGNEKELKIIDEFETTYQKDQAVYWFTRQCFISKMLNKALRIPEPDVSFRLRLFIQHLIQQTEYESVSESLTVYLGQTIQRSDLNDIEINIANNDIMIFPQFLLGTTDESQAIRIAKEIPLLNEAMIPLIIRIEISEDLKCATTTTNRYSVDEDNKILLNMGIIGRLIQIEKENLKEDQLITIHMRLIKIENLKNIEQILETTRSEIKSFSPFVTMINLMMKMNLQATAEQLIETLFNDKNLESDAPLQGSLAASCHILAQTRRDREDYQRALDLYLISLKTFKRIISPNSDELSSLYYNIGSMYFRLSDYDQSHEYYQKALEIHLNSNTPDLYSVSSYTNSIGIVYSKQGKYSDAIKSFERTLKILAENSDSHDAELAATYNNLGDAYLAQGDCDQALNNYSKSLEIQERIEPRNAQTLGTSYHTVGNIYFKLGRSKEALIHLKRALEYLQEVLPSTDAGFAPLYNSMGLMHYREEEYDQALECYSKSLGIAGVSLPENHSLVAITLFNIALVYSSQEKLTEAIETIEKSTEQFLKTLPPDHSDIVENNNYIQSIKQKQVLKNIFKDTETSS